MPILQGVFAVFRVQQSSLWEQEAARSNRVAPTYPGKAVCYCRVS